MKTYFDKETKKYVSFKPIQYWSGLKDYITQEYIYSGDSFRVLNARGHSEPVYLTCSDYICNQANTWIYQKFFKIELIK